ncbi:MAG: hypothetical protein JW776_13200 [Candidatus Lokiarchaeota archaeon]|nr:hypothetical protein [Candidatus Lokiarchaeota archaeon]
MYNSVMTQSKLKQKTKNVTTTIKEDDYKFLKKNNLQVSSALSIGVQTLRNIYETGQVKINSEDIKLVRELMDENRNVLKRLGESD